MASGIKSKYVSKADAIKGSIIAAERKGLQEAAKVVRRNTRARAPRLKGGLRRAIATWVRRNRQTGHYELVIGVYTAKKRREKGIKAAHAHFHEFGTRKMRATPFLTPGTRESQGEIRAKIAEQLVGVSDDPKYEAWLHQYNEEEPEDG